MWVCGRITVPGPISVPGDSTFAAGSPTSSPITAPNFVWPVLIRLPSSVIMISSVAGSRTAPEVLRIPVVEQNAPR